jgi:uncharacterized membrane protein/LysM repeat protein
VNRTDPLTITFRHELLAILGLSFVLILTIYLLPLPAVRIILGAPFVLFFPGYTLVAALFPGKDDLEGIERLGLSLGLSIAVLPLMGLALNYTPFGITLLSTLVSATSFMLVTCGIAYYRRGRLPLEERYAVRVELDLAGWRSGGLLDKSLTVALAVSIVAALGTFLFVLAKPEVGERFTEFYILGPDSVAEGYPKEVLAGQSIDLIVGMINREHADVHYRVERDVSGQNAEKIAEIELAHDEMWEEPYTFALHEPGEDQKVSFHLYKEGGEEPYRSLHLWISVLSSGAPVSAETPSATAPPAPGISPTAEASPTPAPLATATPVPSPTPGPAGGPSSTPSGRTVHIVQPGETLSSIARQYGVSYQAIMYANALEDANLIEVGQELIIPHLDEILPTLTPTPAQE